MNFADIDQAWRSPHNQPSPIQVEQTKREFFAMLRRRDRGFVIGMTLVFVWLSLITGRLVWHVLWPDPMKDRIDFIREWAIVPFLILPWIGAILIIWQYRKRRRRHPNYDCTIVGILRALIEQSRLSTARLKNILLLHLIGVPLLALSIQQIYAVGKARPNEIASMIVAMSMVIAISLGCLTYAFFRQRRETQRLEALLQDYE